MKSLKRLQPFFRTFFWLWIAIILVLMIIPTKGELRYNFLFSDKLIHFGLFAILGFLYFISHKKNKKIFPIAEGQWGLVFLLVFSVFIEAVHLLLEYRSFDLMDCFANGLGLVTGIFIGNIITSSFLNLEKD